VIWTVERKEKVRDGDMRQLGMRERKGQEGGTIKAKVRLNNPYPM